MINLSKLITVLKGWMGFDKSYSVIFRSVIFALIVIRLLTPLTSKAEEIHAVNVAPAYMSSYAEVMFEGTSKGSPWEYMGTDVTIVCSAVLPYEYEWGVRYNNDGPILSVTCNGWNQGWRVCTTPEYPTGDAQPFDWGGACWIWGTASTWDDGCNTGYHSYYTQDANGKLNMTGGNGCTNPSVYRRKL